MALTQLRECLHSEFEATFEFGECVGSLPRPSARIRFTEGYVRIAAYIVAFPAMVLLMIVGR